jgi:hypothetical protein
MKNIIILLEQIENIAEENNYSGYLTIEMLEHELATHKNIIVAAEMICAYYSDQDGGEVSDEFYDQVLESIDENN